MIVLKEILELSNYQPTTQGLLLDLYDLLVEGRDRVGAMEALAKKGHQNFNDTYYKLKIRLLDGVLQNTFTDLTSVQKHHVSITKKFTQAKILYKLHKRVAGVKIAEETIRKAEEMGMIEIALSLSRDMEMHFATQHRAHKKYRHYQEKNTILKKSFDEEFLMQRLYIALMYADKNNKKLDSLFEQLKALTEIAQENKNYRFRLFYHHSINRMADKIGDLDLFLSNTETAIEFFNTCKTPLPYTTKWIFLINLLPIHLNNRAYRKVENTINTCLTLPNTGTYNWHLTLLYKALYGFHTNKPALALQACQQAHSVPKKFESPIVTERWLLIEAYIAFFQKTGRLKNLEHENLLTKAKLVSKKKYPKPFKLRKFLNSFSNTSKDDAQRANLLVLEFIHLLADQNLKSYTEKTFLLDNLIPKHFNKVPYRRTKYFLQSLRAVVKGNFHPTGAARHATGCLTKMHHYSNNIDLNLMDKEMVDYGVLWGEVLEILGR